MDEELILHEIIKSLAFEIEAVNQDNVLKWTSINGTPLNVKVRVRNKDEPRLIQRGAIPVPRIGVTAPEKLRLISSDQTILSFNVYLEGGLEKESKRDNGFKKFHIGNCLGTYSDDEGPYLPSSSEQNALVVDNDVKCQPKDSNVGSDVCKNNVTQPVFNAINTVPQSQKTFFGKCKPGGCLDPPFGEDSYAYSRTNADRVENIHLKVLQDNKETVEPGGCLEPPFSEDVYPYSNPRIEKKNEKELKSQFIKDNKQGLSKKSSEERDQYKTQDTKIIKGEDDSKKIKDIYARISKENLLESKYSNSLITYPTDVSSTDTLHDQISNKKMSIKSNDDVVHKQSYDYPVSYFVPPKEMRYKDEEGRYSRRRSSDTVYSSSKGAVNDETDKTKKNQPENISRKVLLTNVQYEHDPKLNFAKDIASKSYRTEKEAVAVEQENPGPDTVMKISSRIHPLIQNDKDRESSDLKPMESISNSKENQHSKLQRKTGLPTDNDMPNYEKTVENRQTSPVIPISKVADRDAKDDLPQSEVTHITGAQTASHLGTQREKSDSEPKTQINQQYSPFSNTQYPIQDNSRNHLSTNNNEHISQKIAKAEATIPILATATLNLSDKQAIKCNDSEINQSKRKVGLDSSMIEINKGSVSKGADRDAKDVLPQSEVAHITGAQPASRLGTQSEKPDPESKTQINQEHSQFSNTQCPTQGNSRNNLSTNNNEHISKQIAIAEATIPVLATTTLNLSEKQSIKCNDSEINLSKPTVGLDSSMIEINKGTISKRADRDAKDVLPPSEVSHITGAQTASRIGTQREKPDSESKTQINQEYSQFSNTQCPTRGNSRNHLSTDNNVAISKKIAAASAAATIPILATATLDLSEKQSIKCNDSETNQSKPKVGLDSPMIEKNKDTVYNIISADPKKRISNQKLQNKPMLSPECTSSSENNEFDVSSEQSIESKHDLLNIVEPHKPEVTFENRDKRDILADSLNVKRNENVIISNKVSEERYIKDLEHQKTRTSEILQKKPFTARHDLDIEQDDINKTAASKRKTFKVIASDNSIQKSLHNEELPEIITDVSLKTTSISQFNSPDSTKIARDNSDTNNKTQDSQSTASQINVRSKTTDLPSKVSDSQLFYTSAKLDEKGNVERTLNTSLDGNLSNFLLKNVTYISPTINQTNPVVSTQNENQVNPLRNLVPKDVKDIELNVVDERKSVMSSNIHYKDIQPLKPEIIQGYTVDEGKEKTLATGKQSMENILLGGFSKHSFQTTMSVYTKDSHTKESISDISAINQTEIVYLDKKESAKILNIDFDKSIHNTHIDNLLSNSVADDIIFNDSTKERLSQNEERHLNDNSELYPESREKLNLIRNIDRLPSSDNTIIDAPLKLLSNELQSNNNNKYHIDSKSNQIDFLRKYDNSEDDATQVVIIPQTLQDFGSATNNKTNNKTVHIKELDNKELEDAVHDELSTNIIPTISPKSEDNINAETADATNYANINDYMYVKHGYFNTHHNDYPEEIELPPDISEVPRIQNAPHVETERDTKNSIHSVRYSGLISGVLSNISENKEGEESNTKQNTASEDTIKRREDIVKLDNKSALSHEEINTERASISKKSESIMANHTYEVNDGSYEIHSAQLNMSKEVVFRDITNDINDQPREYGTSQISSSANEILGLNTKSSRVQRASSTGPSTRYKQPANIATKSTPLKKDISPLYLDMSFRSYVNDNKQRVVQTQSPLFNQHTPNNGTITTLKTLIRHGNEIRIPVDNENDITLNILDKDARVENINNVGLPTSHTRREKHFGDRMKNHNDILNKNLSLIYQSNLIPLHTVIKDLTQEVNTLAKKQEILQMRMLNTKRTKSLRLIPVVKRCGCRRV